HGVRLVERRRPLLADGNGTGGEDRSDLVRSGNPGPGLVSRGGPEPDLREDVAIRCHAEMEGLWGLRRLPAVRHPGDLPGRADDRGYSLAVDRVHVP